MFEPNKPPSCFGKHWSDKAPPCTGGLDPTWTDPASGSHVRERCTFYNSCGVTTQAAKQQFIPASQLVRPPTASPSFTTPQPSRPAYPTPPQVNPAATQMTQAAQLQQLMQHNAQLQEMLRQQAAQQSVRGPMMTYPGANMLPVDYRMPSYLSVPEPKNGNVWSMLGRSITRSLFKSAGHTLAAFWDTTPFGEDQE